MRVSFLGVNALLFTICFSFRLIDVFLIHASQTWETLNLTKMFGVLVIIAYLVITKQTPGKIGFAGRDMLKGLRFGGTAILFSFFLAYSTEILLLHMAGENPRVIIALTLLASNLINSAMEEGLFRGIMLRERTLKTNLAQALFFGLWQIVWTLKDYHDGRLDLGHFIALSIGITIAAAIIGFAFGLVDTITNSSWSSWTAHIVNNSFFNYLAVRSGTDTLNHHRNLREVIVMLVFLSIGVIGYYFWSKGRERGAPGIAGVPARLADPPVP
jgi:membrane protease YdiL (CAAX protease family)